MSRVRTPGDGPKCVVCGKPAVWSGYCKMEDGKGYCDSTRWPTDPGRVFSKEPTPAELIADVIEERGRLYWETVDKFVETMLDEWKLIKPRQATWWEHLRSSCGAYGFIAFDKPFDAFIVLYHSKHANSGVFNGLESLDKMKLAFAAGKPFPWSLLAVNALFYDCASILREKLKGELHPEVLPHG